MHLTRTTLLLLVSIGVTPTTAFMATAPRAVFGVTRTHPNTLLFDTEDEANEWYSPPIPSTTTTTTTTTKTIHHPVKTAPHESVITSAIDLEEFLQDEDDRLTIVKYHASWCKACARFNLRLDKIKSEHGDVVNTVTGDILHRGDIRFASVEWGANEELCQAQGIEKLPTTRFYINGILQKEITGGAKKFEQHKDAINYYLQKQQKRKAASDEEYDMEKTLNTGSAMIGQYLVPPRNKPLSDAASFV
ncbi:hypothetical protein FisN_16Lh065 [Fistulifera solaris]|uniref:Thioredoxin domain-containing protein n=1 Tax=Fistulifera solaris TaxID=1519565 RepID=A0A1Z5KJ04_FISSO|nr:hypothetical protein FisN_16Lh065 [Fistulifera solaris]|eukprot:GAX26236.1 hypothetical protein FisN_16Lh065 [Fistulifera solaris]